jgi:hypothetical protein
MNIPDEGYSRNVSCAWGLISSFLLDIKTYNTNIKGEQTTLWSTTYPYTIFSFQNKLKKILLTLQATPFIQHNIIITTKYSTNVNTNKIRHVKMST